MVWKKYLEASFVSLFLVSGVAFGQETIPQLSVDIETEGNASLWWSDLFPDYVIERSDHLGSWEMPVTTHQSMLSNFEYLEALRSGKAFFRLRQQETSGVSGGLNFLIATQRERGLWTLDDVDSIPSTISVLGALSTQSQTDLRFAKSFNLASAGLQDLNPTNHDELARLMIARAALSVPSDELVDQLLEGQNPDTGAASLAVSRGGWGILPGFSDSNLE